MKNRQIDRRRRRKRTAESDRRIYHFKPIVADPDDVADMLFNWARECSDRIIAHYSAPSIGAWMGDKGMQMVLNNPRRDLKIGAPGTVVTIISVD